MAPKHWGKGDRVKNIDPTHKPYGYVGTVTNPADSSGLVWVLFDGEEHNRPFRRDQLRWISRGMGKGGVTIWKI